MEQHNIAIMIKIASVMLEKSAYPLLQEFDLTFSQFKILILLHYVADGPVRQIDIEERFAMSNPSVTGVLNNLEKKGLICRVPNPEDKRSNLIVPTEKSREIAPRLWEIRDELDGLFTRDLTAEEKAQLRHILRKIIKP